LIQLFKLQELNSALKYESMKALKEKSAQVCTSEKFNLIYVLDVQCYDQNFNPDSSLVKAD